MRFSLVLTILGVLFALSWAKPVDVVKTLQLAEANTSQIGKANKENVGVDVSQLQGTLGVVLDVLSAKDSPLALLG